MLAAVLALALLVPSAPTARVNDYAGLLAGADRARLETFLAEREGATGAQMVIAIFSPLEGGSLEDYSEADLDAIADAVRNAEAETSGEIRVHLDRRLSRDSRGKPRDALERGFSAPMLRRSSGVRAGRASVRRSG